MGIHVTPIAAFPAFTSVSTCDFTQQAFLGFAVSCFSCPRIRHSTCINSIKISSLSVTHCKYLHRARKTEDLKPSVLQDHSSATLDTVLWSAPKAILACLDSGPDADEAPLAMVTWRVWDVETPGANPEGLMVQPAGFCDVQNATPAQQGPHLKAVFIPHWNVLLAVHRNSHNYHLKIFGEPLAAFWPE